MSQTHSTAHQCPLCDKARATVTAIVTPRTHTLPPRLCPGLSPAVGGGGAGRGGTVSASSIHICPQAVGGGGSAAARGGGRQDGVFTADTHVSCCWGRHATNWW